MDDVLGTQALKPEELATLAEKVAQGGALTEDEVTRVVVNLPHLKKSADGLYSRAKTAEEELGQYKTREKQAADEKARAAAAAAGAVATPPPAPRDEIEEVLQLRGKGFSDTELLTGRRYAKKLGIPLAEAMEDPAVKAFVEAERSKAKVGSATPAPSARASVMIGEKPWGELTPAERDKNVGEAFKKAVQERGKNSTE